jgi:hypothetical protein
MKRKRAIEAAVVFVGFVCLYLSNGDLLIGNDPKPNVYVGASLLSEGDLSFTADEAPFMFAWELIAPHGTVLVRFDDWEKLLGRYPAVTPACSAGTTAPWSGVCH